MVDSINNVHHAVAELVAYGLPFLFVVLLGVAIWREYERWMSK